MSANGTAVAKPREDPEAMPKFRAYRVCATLQSMRMRISTTLIRTGPRQDGQRYS
jgi:hypothetical protein